MTTRSYRVAILFPADAEQGAATRLDRSRFASVADALRAAGAEPVGAPWSDDRAQQVRMLLRSVDCVLVWLNPIEAGRDRTVLNALLREVAAAGVLVSAHPDVIDRMGTKEVLHLTRGMGWGSETRLYPTIAAIAAELPARLASGAPLVLKQIRGQSGDGVWKVELADGSPAEPAAVSPQTMLRVRHARRGSGEESLTLAAFLARCRPYFATGGGMLDQPWQPRITEGMVRCYVVGGRVEGFGEQLVNMLYPAPPGAPASAAPLPGPRLYFPPTRPDFQRLKDHLEREWTPELCRLAGLAESELPLLWDADFLYGPKDATGADTYVLCEINVSSVYPFPESALTPLVSRTLERLAGRR